MARSNDHLQNSRSSMAIYQSHGHGPGILQHSKSSGNMQQQLLQSAARQHAVQMANLGAGPRTILVSHPMQIGHVGVGVAMQSSQMPLVNSASSGNILHVSSIELNLL